MEGAFPDLPKVVLIGAPHSSNWDGVWGFAVLMALGLDLKVLGKDTLLKVPVMGPVLKRLGVIPVDRKAAQGVVEQAAQMIRSADRFWYGLAPEGTRKVVEKWKPWLLAHRQGRRRAGGAGVFPLRAPDHRHRRAVRADRPLRIRRRAHPRVVSQRVQRQEPRRLTITPR
jgi:1-acyl-sn-glycerol-3-phosphate acyltransferase